MITGISVIFQQVELHPDDVVIIVSDTGCEPEVGRLLFEEAIRRGADATWSQIKSRSVHGEELPGPAITAIQSSGLAILATSVSASYAPGVTAAIQKGVRVLSMPGVNLEMLRQGAMTADYTEVQRLTDRWGERLARGRRVTITTPAGTNLSVDIGGWSRAPLLDCGRFPRGHGCMGNLPAGEAAVSPIEGTATGRVVADLTVSTTRGPLTTPVTIEIESGHIVQVGGGEEAKAFESALSQHGDSARVVAEVALGTNSAARHLGIVIEDEKALGTAHVGFGHAIGLGGTNISGIHVDAIFDRATFCVDDVPLIVDGVPTDAGLQRETLSSLAGVCTTFERGPAQFKIVDGHVHASWHDLHGSEYWSQVGDEQASRAVRGVLESEQWEVEQGSDEARASELLARYGVLSPIE